MTGGRAREVRARRVSRALLPLALVAVVVLAIAGGVRAWKARERRARALAVIASLDPNASNLGNHDEELAREMLQIAPDVAEGHALLATACAERGDLDPARDELASAGEGPWARRARAWVLYRSDDVAGACAVAPELAAHFAFFAGEPVAKLADEDEWWDELASGHPATAGTLFARLDALAQPFVESADALGAHARGMIQIQVARLLRARIALVALDDGRADELLADSLAIPCRLDHRLAVEAARALAAIRAGSEVGAAPAPARPAGELSLAGVRAKLDDFLVSEALDRARIELAHDRLFDRPDERARAIERLRRALALPTSSSRAALLHALDTARGRKPRRPRGLLERLAEDDLRGKPADVLARLEADAIAREDPVAALAILAPQLEDRVDPIAALALGLELPDEPAALAKKLQAHGLSADDAQALAGTVERWRSWLAKAKLLR